MSERERKPVRDRRELIQFRKSTHFKEESERDSKRQERERLEHSEVIFN